MTTAANTARQSSYLVEVGHYSVEVQSVSAADAIREARKQLCQQMPRLWDVIQSLRDDKFHVCPM